jgi:cytochrome P450
LQSSLRTLIARFPNLALDRLPVRRPEFVIRGVVSLPVTI